MGTRGRSDQTLGVALVLPRKYRCQGAKNRAEILNQNQRVAGAPEEIRTPDPQIRSLVLYPAELRALDSAAGNRTTAPRHSYRLDPPLARVGAVYAYAACAAQASASFSIRIR